MFNDLINSDLTHPVHCLTFSSASAITMPPRSVYDPASSNNSNNNNNNNNDNNDNNDNNIIASPMSESDAHILIQEVRLSNQELRKMNQELTRVNQNITTALSSFTDSVNRSLNSITAFIAKDSYPKIRDDDTDLFCLNYSYPTSHNGNSLDLASLHLNDKKDGLTDYNIKSKQKIANEKMKKEMEQRSRMMKEKFGCDYDFNIDQSQWLRK